MSCPSASLPPLSLPATAAAVLAGRPVTVVALGSSSTEGSGASAPDKTYPAVLERVLKAAWPTVDVRVLNKGIGGQDADSELTRFDRDVIAERPVLVIWQVGTNAALHHTDLTLFRDSLDTGLNRIAATGADVVLMDNQVAPRVDREPGQEVYDPAIAAAAAAHDAALFSRTALMRQWQASGVSEMVGSDGLHHTDRGYACVADALGRAIIRAATSHVADLRLHP